MKVIEELWITYSVGTKFCYVAVHDVVASIGKARAMAMTGFHAFTGCDTTSTFFGKGKKSAYAIWEKHPVFQNEFLELSGQITKQ